MNTSTTISLSNRIAAGVTAEYVRDLVRRPASAAAPAPATAPASARRAGRGPVLHGRRIVSAARGRDRDDCGRRRAGHGVTVTPA
jgi:hypothetical protein